MTIKNLICKIKGHEIECYEDIDGGNWYCARCNLPEQKALFYYLKHIYKTGMQIERTKKRSSKID